jgi:cell wall-associated NlpC family hydrolase
MTVANQYKSFGLLSLAVCFFVLISTACTSSIRFTRDQSSTQSTPSTPSPQHPDSIDSAAKRHPPPPRGHAPKGSPKHLEQVIATYLGIPYKYGGMSRSAVDCSGFVSLVFLEVYDKPLPRSSAQMWNAGHHVSPSAARPGDLVFFRNGFGPIDHVGIYMGDNRFVHASSSVGVTYSDLGKAYYARRFAGFKRM